MAEAYLGSIYGDEFEVESGGMEPAETVNPLVVQAMAEAGFDLSAKRPQSVFDLFKEGKLYDHVITVCNDAEEKCPLFPGITKRWHWPFPDPANVSRTDAQKLEAVRLIRDKIRDLVVESAAGHH